jgi:hypothetical protein
VISGEAFRELRNSNLCRRLILHHTSLRLVPSDMRPLVRVRIVSPSYLGYFESPYSTFAFWWMAMDSNHRAFYRKDLQSLAFNLSASHPNNSQSFLSATRFQCLLHAYDSTALPCDT